MKKIIFSICLAALAVGCTKTEVNYTEPDQIAFAPVASNVTKAALGEGDVPTSDLIVSAFAGTGTDQAAYTEAYFKNVEFKPGTTDATKRIFTANGYFWPNVKKLTFAGITKSAGLSDNSSVLIYDAAATTADDRNKFIIYNYSQPQSLSIENQDFMWFDRTTPSAKMDAAISVEMKHACSWIVLNFYGDETAGNTTRPWKITNVTLNNLSDKESVTLGANAVWTSTGNKNVDIEVYNNGSKTTGGTGMQQSTLFTPNANSIIVIPQKPTTLSVTYNYLSQGIDTPSTDDDIVIEETATVKLNYDGEADNSSTWSSWAPGFKYTYNIQLTATGIKIAPTASAWTDYDSKPGTTDKDPIEKRI